MGGTTSKYGVSGLGGQRGRVMSMALDRVRDEGIPMGEALQQSWQFVANEAMGVEQEDRFQATQAPAPTPALTPAPPVKEPLANFKKNEYHSEDIGAAIKREYGASAVYQHMVDFFNLYTVDELKSINKVDKLVLSSMIRNSKNKDRIVSLMADAVRAHVNQGSVFWDYE